MKHFGILCVTVLIREIIRSNFSLQTLNLSFYTLGCTPTLKLTYRHIPTSTHSIILIHKLKQNPYSTNAWIYILECDYTKINTKNCKTVYEHSTHRQAHKRAQISTRAYIHEHIRTNTRVHTHVDLSLHT